MQSPEFNRLRQSVSSPRIVSGLELMLGAAIVIGHNVFHVVPNEVPILFVLGWISIRPRDGGWNAIGLRAPGSRWKTVAWALVSAAAIVVLSDMVVGPIAERFVGAERESKWFATPAHDFGWAPRSLGLIWTFAAFGEEMGYRGYLMTRAAGLVVPPRPPK